MKYDLSKKPTRGARRTLDAFTGALLELLTERSFESVTVNELCQRSGYPRATFYNYFDDKFDLLNYCWHRIGELIHLDEGPQMLPEEGVHVFFDRICGLCEGYAESMRLIMQTNGDSSFLRNQLRSVFGERIQSMMQGCEHREGADIPHRLLASHYANTLLLVLEYHLLDEPPCTNEEAHKYLHALLEGV